MHCGDYGRNVKVKKYVNLNDPNALDVRLMREQLHDMLERADAVQPQHGGGEGLDLEVKPEEVPQNVAVTKPDENTVSASSTEETKPDEKSLESKSDEAKTVNVKPDEAQTIESKSGEIKLEIKPDETKVELNPDETKIEVKPDESKEESQPDEVTKPENEVVVEQTSDDGNDADWKDREAKLLKIITNLELVKNDKSEDSLKLELKLREEEAELLKARIKNLETELHAALSKPSGKNHEMIENIKQQHEELLSKARGMIFDKTKMVKNQELQIEALSTQVQSLKDVNMITKDLLEIRNSEIKAMEERLQAMEARFKAEKERFGLVLQRAQTSTNINTDLKKEYETQLNIFKELRSKYDQRVQALVAENERLKASVNGAPST